MPYTIWEMWETKPEHLQTEFENLLAQAEKFGDDALIGGRASLLETCFQDLRKRIKKAGDEIAFYDFTFEPIKIEKVERRKYVIGKRNGKLHFLLGGEYGGSHANIAEHHGFKREDCLGGGFVTINPEKREFELFSDSEGLGSNRVLEKTENALYQVTHPRPP